MRRGQVMPSGAGGRGVGGTAPRAFLIQYLQVMNAESRLGLIFGIWLFTVCPIIAIGAPLPTFLVP